MILNKSCEHSTINQLVIHLEFNLILTRRMLIYLPTHFQYKTLLRKSDFLIFKKDLASALKITFERCWKVLEEANTSL